MVVNQVEKIRRWPLPSEGGDANGVLSRSIATPRKGVACVSVVYVLQWLLAFGNFIVDLLMLIVALIKLSAKK